jgi:hypothetical protein
MSPDDLLSESPDKLQNRRKGDPRSVALAVITVAIVAGILLVMKLSGSNASEARIVSPQVSQNTSRPSNQPTAHTVALSDHWSPTVYLSTANSGQRISFDVVEDDVPLLTRINGQKVYSQSPRKSPEYRDLNLESEVLSIEWAVPSGFTGTVTYTITAK